MIPQHLPEGDDSKERTVQVTGDKKIKIVVIWRANLTVLEGLGAHLEGNCTCCILYLVIGGMYVLIAKKLIVNTCNF